MQKRTKKRIVRVLKWTGLVIAVVILLALFFPTWTPPIKGENSISMLTQLPFNGADHEVMIRGADRSNPIIIFVHGGPGCSEIPYVRKYQKELEKHYTIVHYDQRGSGKSYHFNEDYSNLTTDILVDDLLELTDVVTEMLDQPKALLAGHSFGTYIGLKAAAKAPEKYYAYIGIGQMSDTISGEIDGLNYTIEQAKLAGNDKDVQELEQMRSSIEQGEGYTPRTMLRKYGGAARLIDENEDYYKGFLLNPEYNGLDVIRYLKGVTLSQEILLAEDIKHPLPSLVQRVELPVYFVMGQYDYMTSVHAAKQYFAELEAPQKTFVTFEQSAHYPQFEEKEKFLEWLNETFEYLAK